MLVLRACGSRLRMLVVRWPRFWGFLLGLFCLVAFNEFLLYYVVLLQCSWPALDYAQADFSVLDGPSDPLRVMMLADTHLLGRTGHWFDRMRREWQMERSFQSVRTIHNPSVVFILGDVFDEGKWSDDADFEYDVSRFRKMFRHSEGTELHVVAGNHDVGFHYMMSEDKVTRFTQALQAPPVRRVDIASNTFILINSMALEGDGCDICREAEETLRDMRETLNCAMGNPSQSCTVEEKNMKYTRPILLQHFPMYRKSDSNCTGRDAAGPNERNERFKEKWDCLSKKASQKLFSWFEPRLIVSGHTHNGCYRRHPDGVPEYTVSSFNWRNRNNPTFLLAVITNNNFAITTCYLPEESTVIYCYVAGVTLLILWACFPRHLFSSSPSRKVR